MTERVRVLLVDGASGFLLKRSSPEQLIAAIHTVAEGEALLSPSVTRRLIERVAAHPILNRGPDPRLAGLTTREREVLDLIAQGLSNAEIAEAMTLERSTIKSHVQRILAKLGARNRVEIVILADEWGLITPGNPPHSAARGAHHGTAVDTATDSAAVELAENPDTR